MSENAVVKDEDGKELSAEATLEALLDSHCPESTKVKPADAKQFNVTTKKAEENFKWLTHDLVGKSIKAFSTGKAPGPDKIVPIMMKHLPKNILKRLSWLMKACLESGYTGCSAFVAVTLMTFFNQIEAWKANVLYMRGKPLL